MNLIDGIDFQTPHVDYDDYEEQLLKDTYDTNIRLKENGRYLPLWEFLDYSFDSGARHPILLNVEFHFNAVQDFCKHIEFENKDIPSLYKRMFDISHGFLTQAKMPYLMKDKWFIRFPDAIKPKIYNTDIPNILIEFQSYLQTHITPRNQSVLIYLHRYINGDESIEDES